MRDRLIEIFKKTDYNIFPNSTVSANLANQFSEYALNDIVDKLLANGVIVPPCKVGDTVYWISNGEVIECFVYEISQGFHDEEICLRLHIRGKWCALDLQPIYPYPHENVLFFNKEEAERALKGGAE